MRFPTWTSRGRRRGVRWSVVALTVVVAVLVVATAAVAWLPDAPSGGWTAERPPAIPDDPPTPDRPAPVLEPVWHCPVDGRVGFRDDFGYRKPGGRIHRGVDLYAPLGTPAVAPQPGRVERSEGGTAGKQVILHAEGRRYVFAHLSRFGAAGHVGAGETVGYVGTSGNARGAAAHLHFEIRDATGATDPYPLLHEHCR